jgi:hypothetical protein
VGEPRQGRVGALGQLRHAQRALAGEKLSWTGGFGIVA